MLVFENILLLLSAILLLVGLIKKANAHSINLAVVVIYVLHFMAGNPLWQFIPLYAVVTIASIIPFIRIRQIWVKRTLIAIGVVCLLISQAAYYVLPVFTLPATTGSYNISAIANNLDNNLSYKLWFPVNTVPESNKKTSYSSDLDDLSIMGMPKFIFSHLKRVKTNALEDGQIANQKFPLIIYSHGASSIMVDNTALMEEIASHGYIVLALQHNFSFEKYGININDAKKADATIQIRLIDRLLEWAVPEQVNDYKIILNSIQKIPNANHIDFTNLGLIGHSLGGATVTSVPAITKHVKAIVNIDGPIPKSIGQKYAPSFLYISSFSTDLTDYEFQDFNVPPEFYRTVKNYELQNVKKFIEMNSSNTSWVRFKTSNHLDLTDMPFVMPLLVSKNFDKLEGHQLKSDIIVAFFNRELKNESNSDQIENETIEWIKR